MRPSSPSSRKFARRLRRAGVVAGVLLLLFGALSLDCRPKRQEGEPRLLFAGTRSGPLLAGAGKAELRLPEDLPLAGYRPFGRQAERPGAPLYARSLLLQVGELRTAIVVVELMTMPEALAQRIGGLLDSEGADCGIVAATHTHSGPGGYDRELLPQAVAVGRFDEDVERAIAHAVAGSLAAARADLGPAELSIAEGLPALNGNRDRRGAPADDRLTRILLERTDGRRVAQVLRFAAHPTLNARGVGPHGDWPGEAMDLLEEEGGVTIVLQGAVGDARAEAGPDRAAAFAGRFAERVHGLHAGPAARPLTLGCAEAELDLPAAALHSMVPWPLGQAASNLASFAAGSTARTVALRLDELVLLAVPAEPTFAAASLAEQVVEARGFRGRTVSLAQGYVGYAPTQEEVEARVFSSRFAWYGGELAGRLAAGEAKAAEAVTRALLPPKRLEVQGHGSR